MKLLPRRYEMTASQAIFGNEIREGIVTHLIGSEGGTDYFSRIRKTLNLNNGSANYHLRVLEEKGVIKSEMQDNKKWYRLKGITSDSSDLRNIESDILSIVSKHEDGLRPMEIARFMLVRYSMIANSLQKLSQNGEILHDLHNGRYYPVSQPGS